METMMISLLVLQGVFFAIQVVLLSFTSYFGFYFYKRFTQTLSQQYSKCNNLINESNEKLNEKVQKLEKHYKEKNEKFENLQDDVNDLKLAKTRELMGGRRR